MTQLLCGLICSTCQIKALPVKVALLWLHLDFRTKQRETHTEPGFRLSHIRGDMGGGSTGTWPHVRVCILIKALFVLARMRQRDQTEVRAKLTSAANIYIYKDNYSFPEHSFGATSTKLCGKI